MEDLQSTLFFVFLINKIMVKLYNKIEFILKNSLIKSDLIRQKKMLSQKKFKEPEISPIPLQNLFKIPKKPFYRSAIFDSDKRAKRIQIKLWKITSFKIRVWATEVQPSSLLASQKSFSQAINQLSKKQRVLKNLRRLCYNFNEIKNINLNKLIFKSWKLEKLTFSCND